MWDVSTGIVVLRTSSYSLPPSPCIQQLKLSSVLSRFEQSKWGGNNSTDRKKQQQYSVSLMRILPLGVDWDIG